MIPAKTIRLSVKRVDVANIARKRRRIEATCGIDRFRKGEREMAHIDEANFGGHLRIHANVSDVVGVGGKNERNDVMLIQALFKLYSLTEGNIQNYLPKITGVLDHETIQAIWAFQRDFAVMVLSVDGAIHPASYSHRLINPSGRLMTITALNQMALRVALDTFHLDLITALKAIVPQLILRPYDTAA